MESVISVLTAALLPAAHKMIITYYGNGKGKTTAALGLLLRASGYDKKILFAQFIKSPESKTGEDKSLKKLKNVTHKKFGLGFVGILNDSHTMEEHKIALNEGFKYLEENFQKFQIIVLDEILVAIKMKMLPLRKLLHFLTQAREKGVDVVLTGRGKNHRLVEASDLATEFKEIKHPFKDGMVAKRAIDY